MNDDRPRFVVLRHTVPADYARHDHWDLMVQQGDALRTWAMTDEPRPHAAIDVQQLEDHRLAYLDYEGPVSNDRGHVVRWDAGNCQIVSEDEREIRVRLLGQRLFGLASLRLVYGQRWVFMFTPADSATR